MRSFALIVLVLVLLPSNSHSQNLTAADTSIIQLARSKYYDLEEHGFESATCSVNFDWSTIPALNSQQGDPDRKLLESTRFTLKLGSREQPTVQYAYPPDSSGSARQRITPMADMLRSFAAGLFQTWPTKGLLGPIPPFDSEIESVSTTASEYRLILRVPGGPVRVEMNKNYLVTEMVSADGKIDEKPVYSPTPDGLVFTGNSAIDNSEQNSRVAMVYELGDAVIDGLHLPASARLRVNKNIDLKFTLTGCSVAKAKVITLNPN